METLAIGVRELTFDEVTYVSGGANSSGSNGETCSPGNSFADNVRDVADFIKGMIKGFSD